MKRGIFYAVSVYFLWGISPIYWKLLQNINSIEVIAHRIIWAFIFVLFVDWAKKNFPHLKLILKEKKIILIYLLSGALLFINWLAYVWAVNSGLIVDASLGYFINPLVNVVLGVLILKERLKRSQWIPVIIAASGVLYLTLSYGSLPWIGLVLSFTFGLYGFIKKTAPLNSIQGFTLETGLLFIPAVAFLLFISITNQDMGGQRDLAESFLLMFTGIVTGVPLLLFGSAARLIPLSTMGFIQYIAPTMQFLIGVIIYGEEFTFDRMIGFGLIWIALILFSIQSLQIRNRTAVALQIE
jgi:chloramphenicol-sensitive protein RarD